MFAGSRLPRRTKPRLSEGNLPGTLPFIAFFAILASIIAETPRLCQSLFFKVSPYGGGARACEGGEGKAVQ